MARAEFKSDRHAALSNTYPPEVTHCGGISRRAWMPVQPAVFGPYMPTWRDRLRRLRPGDVRGMAERRANKPPRPLTVSLRVRLKRALRSLAINFRSPL